MTFRYLQSKCAAYGGSLTKLELDAAREEFVAGLFGTLDLFDGIHGRCMRANGVVTPRLFTDGRMLPSLLYVCRDELVGILCRCGTMSFRQADSGYDAVAAALRRRLGGEAEAEVKLGYIDAAVKHGQNLTLEKLLQEPNIKGVLDKCRRLLADQEFIRTILAPGASKTQNAAEDGKPELCIAV